MFLSEFQARFFNRNLIELAFAQAFINSTICRVDSSDRSTNTRNDCSEIQSNILDSTEFDKAR